MGKMVTLIYPTWKLAPSTKFYASTATFTEGHTHQTRCQRSWIHGDRSWLSSIRTHRRNPERTGFACFWRMRTRRVCDSFGQYPARVFERYMNKYCSVWSYNNKQLQSLILHFCDHYDIWFCVFKAQKYSLTELLRSVSSDTGLKDYLTHKFACTLIQLQ